MKIGLGAIKNHIPKSMGKTGKFLKTYGLNGAFFVLPALYAYGYKYNSSGQEVQGTNWESGNKAVAKGIAKAAGFTAANAATAAIACGIAGPLAVPVAALGLFLSFTKVPEWIEKLFPDEGEVVKKACAENGIAYNPPSILGSLTGGGSMVA